MSNLIDQADRDRFTQEHSTNISVIAPAGVGKTTSIVGRIVGLAKLPDDEAVKRLQRLIVVTYSVRAAQQMQQKARVGIRDAKVSHRVQRAFQQAFFGTIHSYCVRLLDRFGHYLGLPSPVGLLEDNSELWQRFLLRGLGPESAPDTNLENLFYFYAPEKLYALGMQISPGREIAIGPLPELNWKPLFDYNNPSLHHGTKRSIVRAQEAALVWREAWARGDRHRPLPECPSSDKAADFAEIWRETFQPLHEWLRDAALAFGRHIANRYAAFRLLEARMTYDDQVRLALQVLDHPEAQRELASEQISVLLDEAQDTDPRQFEVLRRVAGLSAGLEQACDQTFSIVGDFQQAIYAPRSDLNSYRKVHAHIVEGMRGAESKLRVTFRCDTAIIEFVNRIFPSILNNSGGQSAFEELVPRHDAGPGQVVRWECPDEPKRETGEKISAEDRATYEAKFFADKIKQLGPQGLGASSWSQVAVLCPRTQWLRDIQHALSAAGVPVQLHSSNEQRRDRTTGSWLTALIWIAAHPEDSFEIAGVLREILGVSDHDMALHTKGDGDWLRIDQVADETTPVGAALKVLIDACKNTDALPLTQAVQQLVEKTALRDRLRLIGKIELENTDHELDDFLGVIAGRSAEGITLVELAEELRLGLTQVHPAEEEIQDKIQLLTSHKSKGLEWEAVIVPYVFRAIESKSLTYPRVLQGDGGSESICRDKSDFASPLGELVKTRDRQQYQRLLYVMATRAKRSLILVDDEVLFDGSRKGNGWPAGELLSFTSGPNRSGWKELPETCSLPALVPVTKPRSAPGNLSFPKVTRKDIDQAIKQARDFPRRITPHTLAVHVREEADPEVAAELEDDVASEVANNPGVLYGTWWHEFVETLPWGTPIATWEKKFNEARVYSPQPERAIHEWELFRKSEIAAWLAEPGRLVQVEIPFLWQEKDKLLLEGVMDLAVYTEKDATWDVIDWKTNYVGDNDGARLVETYRKQIEAYVGALRQMLSVEVRGSLYLTQTGAWERLK